MSSAVSEPHVLVVDDIPANLVVMRRLLVDSGARLVEARSGNEALAAALERQFALILLDVNMPGMDGFEVAELLGSEELNRRTPIIFVTAAMTDELSRTSGYHHGAVDYITKPVSEVILLAKVRIFLDLYRSHAALKQAMQELDQRNQQLQAEIVERQRVEARVRHEALHDPLTGLCNIRMFSDRLRESLALARQQRSIAALFYVDIDNFKPVNDRYGHQLGDELLRSIAARLKESIRLGDTAARLGGDEFALIMQHPRDMREALQAAQRVCDSLSQSYRIGPDPGIEIHVGASIGIALFPLHASDPTDLVRLADEAMYRAKRSGKNLCLMATPPPPLKRSA